MIMNFSSRVFECGCVVVVVVVFVQFIVSRIQKTRAGLLFLDPPLHVSLKTSKKKNKTQSLHFVLICFIFHTLTQQSTALTARCTVCVCVFSFFISFTAVFN